MTQLSIFDVPAPASTSRPVTRRKTKAAPAPASTPVPVAWRWRATHLVDLLPWYLDNGIEEGWRLGWGAANEVARSCISFLDSLDGAPKGHRAAVRAMRGAPLDSADMWPGAEERWWASFLAVVCLVPTEPVPYAQRRPGEAPWTPDAVLRHLQRLPIPAARRGTVYGPPEQPWDYVGGSRRRAAGLFLRRLYECGAMPGMWLVDAVAEHGAVLDSSDADRILSHLQEQGVIRRGEWHPCREVLHLQPGGGGAFDVRADAKLAKHAEAGEWNCWLAQYTWHAIPGQRLYTKQLIREAMLEADAWMRRGAHDCAPQALSLAERWLYECARSPEWVSCRLLFGSPDGRFTAMLEMASVAAPHGGTGSDWKAATMGAASAVPDAQGLSAADWMKVITAAQTLGWIELEEPYPTHIDSWIHNRAKGTKRLRCLLLGEP